MKNQSFTATIEVSKSPGEVYNCITTGVPEWWGFKDFKGESSKLNDEFVISHEGAHYSKQKLVEVVPDKKLIWLVTESRLDWLQKDKAEWTNTKMVFEISLSGDKTVLKFTHEGLSPDKECYAMCEKGWTMIITDFLFHYITFGIASPEIAKAAQTRNQILNDKMTQ